MEKKRLVVGVVAISVAVTLIAFYTLDERPEGRQESSPTRNGEEHIARSSPPADTAEENESSLAENSSSDVDTPPRTPFVQIVERTGTPPGPLAKTLPELMSKAAGGDGQVAYSIYKALSACSEAPRSEQQFNDAYAQQLTSVKNSQGRSVDDIGPHLSQLESAYKYCDGITDTQIEKAAYWIWFAAENGLIEAKTFFLSSNIPFLESDDATSIWGDASGQAALGITYLSEAAESGSTNAMASYAYYLSNGQIVEQDLQEAAALYFAVAESYSNGDAPESAMRKAANTALERLSSNDADEAVRRGREILESELCCTNYK